MSEPDFTRDGYTIVRRAIPLAFLDAFEQAILDRAGCADWHWASSLRQLETQDKDAFYRALTEPGASAAGLAVVAILSLAVGRVLGKTTSHLYPSTPVAFWNDEHVKRLQYDWHQERSYYPDRFTAHAWFPLFRDVGPEDGPMIVASGSHGEYLPFEAERKPGALTQHRIEADKLAGFEHVPCILPRGDVLVFHENLAHCTGHNESGLPRVAGVVRYFLPLSEPTFEPVLSQRA